MTRSRMITWTAALLGLSLLMGGCGAPPQTNQPTTAGQSQPSAKAQPVPQALLATPTTKANATWGGVVQLVAYDVQPLGDDKYRVTFQFKCLKPTALHWARITHLMPQNTAGLETPDEQQVGLKNWDTLLDPSTTMWQPGKTYLSATEGTLPRAGAPWTVVLGMAELIDNRPGGKIKDVQLSDAGTLRRVPKTPWVVVTDKVGG